jgi:hypothetical protein
VSFSSKLRRASIQVFGGSPVFVVEGQVGHGVRGRREYRVAVQRRVDATRVLEALDEGEERHLGLRGVSRTLWIVAAPLRVTSGFTASALARIDPGVLVRTEPLAA